VLTENFLAIQQTTRPLRNPTVHYRVHKSKPPESSPHRKTLHQYKSQVVSSFKFLNWDIISTTVHMYTNFVTSPTPSEPAAL